MTVNELIQMLKEHPGEMDVIVHGDDRAGDWVDGCFLSIVEAVPLNGYVSNPRPWIQGKAEKFLAICY